MTRKIFFVVVAPHYFHPLAKAQVNVVRILEEWEEYKDKSENLTKLSLCLGKDEVAFDSAVTTRPTRVAGSE